MAACLDDRWRLEDIGCVVYVSCTDYQCPSVPHRLNLGFSPSAYYTPILGMDCEGAAPGVRRAYDYCLAEGKLALVIATELCSCTFFPEGESPDPENVYEVLRSNAIFADASAAILVGYDDNSRYPRILDFENYCDNSFLDDLGYTWRDGRLRVKLSRRVPDLAPKVVGQACRRLLERNNLTLGGIQWFVIHAAGSIILDNIRDDLGIPEQKLSISRKVLREHGNLSSATVAVIGKELMSQDIQLGDKVLVLSTGPGMSGGATLLSF